MSIDDLERPPNEFRFPVRTIDAPVKKYDVELFAPLAPDNPEWTAVLTCHCGQVPERTNVKGLNLLLVLGRVTDTLIKHEEHDNRRPLSRTAHNPE